MGHWTVSHPIKRFVISEKSKIKIIAVARVFRDFALYI